MDLDNLIEELKKDGYKKPQIGLVTPEIRTIDEYVTNAVKFIDEDDDNIDI